MDIKKEINESDNTSSKIESQESSIIESQSAGETENDNTKCDYLWYKLSRLISLLLHPFTLPLYLLLLFFYGNSIVSFAQSKLKIFFIAIILLNTSFIPAIFMSLLRSSGFMRYVSLEERYQRALPLAVAAVSYALCAYIIPYSFFILVIKRFLIAGTVCIVFTLAVSWFWKISVHMVAMGALLAMIFAIEISGVGRMMTAFIVFILLSGMLASARLYLGKNNLTQVGVGFLSGFLIASMVIL